MSTCKDVKFGQKVRILPCAPYCNNELAIVAYVGDEGVTVYLESRDHLFSEACIRLEDGEFEVVG